MLSERIERIEASKTTALTGIIMRLRLQGKEVLDLAVGEPEYETPPNIQLATAKALFNGETRYGPVAGLPALRTQLAEKFPGYTADNIIVTNGSKQGLYSLFQTLINPGDQVVVFAPFWVSFVEQIRLAGGVPVLLDGFPQPKISDLEKALTEKTRCVLVNSPNNPTGAVYPDALLSQMADLTAEKEIFLVSDEAYRGFEYDGPPSNGLFSLAKNKDFLLVVRSFSKRNQMTGFRIGYVAARPEVISAMTRLQSHMCGNVAHFIQYGALAAQKDRGFGEKRAELKEKRDLAHASVNAWAPLEKPGGAFYLFPDIRHLLKKNETDGDWAARLLEQAQVAVVPGQAFGAPGYIRISYAVARQTLETGLEKLREFA